MVDKASTMILFLLLLEEPPIHVKYVAVWRRLDLCYGTSSISSATTVDLQEVETKRSSDMNLKPVILEPVKHSEGDELNTSQGTAGPVMKEVQSNTSTNIILEPVVLSLEDELNHHGEQTVGQPMKRKRSDTNCHQCHKNHKVIGLWCNKCRKRYCISCINRWYPTIELTVRGYKLEALDAEIQTCENSYLNHSHIHFRKGQPVMVDNVLNQALGLSWEPSVLHRAFRKSKREGDYSMDVLNCHNWSEEKIHARKFFKGYYNGIHQGRGEPKILSSGKWPSSGLFKEQLPCHYAEVLRCLPFKHHHYEGSGCLAMAVKQLRMYVSYGPVGEGSHGGIPTRLQSAVSDRVRILMHVGATPCTPLPLSVGDKVQNSNASMHALERPIDPITGTVLDIFVKEDISKVEEYLRKHFKEFSHVSPMHQTPHSLKQTAYLTADHIRKLKTEYGIEPFTFFQKLGDAVLVPAGCLYQMRDLESCVYVDVDFSLESVSACNCSSREYQSTTSSATRKENSLRMIKRNIRARKEVAETSEKKINSLRMIKRSIRARKEVAETSQKKINEFSTSGQS